MSQQETQRSPVSVRHKIIDKGRIVGTLFGLKSSALCANCKDIPFTAGLQKNARTSKVVYLTDLEHIMSMKDNCPCCGLLLECLKKTEYDLFAPPHVKIYLKSSTELKGFDTFNEWLTWYNKRFFADLFQGPQEAWPFGCTQDTGEAKQAMEQAMELFLSAEEKDIHAGGTFRDMMSRGAVNDALEAFTLGIDAAQVIKPGLGGRELAGTNFALSGLKTIASRARAKLPCCIAIRLYGQEEDKFGAISVRAYACGRAPRAPLKEVCHFTLRARDSHEFKVYSGQLWYGRTLQPEIDFKLFRKCLTTCLDEPSHRATCGNEQRNVRGETQPWTFRLVDVDDNKVIQTDFEGFTRPDSGFSYVALSYVWRHVNQDPDEAVLTNTSEARLMKNGSLSRARLAPTIRDAMEIVREMEQRYLWVDKLCVMQNPSTPELKLEQTHTIHNMGRIYNKALLTIVDGNSKGSREGLLKKELRRDRPAQVIATINSKLSIFLPTSSPNSLATWESRAWTFQEKVLSRRMLVCSDGFMQWQCQEAVWREDVNARDVTTEAVAISHSYLKAAQSSIGLSEAERYGLRKQESDSSTRLYRTLAFSQYAKCVHDYTLRTIRNPEETLRACAGIFDILESEEHLNSSFLYGLPCSFMDTALLWQVRYGIRRRETLLFSDESAAKQPAPSWSWAGWELDSAPDIPDLVSLPPQDGQSQGPRTFYRAPFKVYCDKRGIILDLMPEGEERLRPLASIYCLKEDDGAFRLQQVGLLGAPWMRRRESVQGKTHNAPSLVSCESWEYKATRDVPEVNFQGLSDRHLIICTEEAELYMGPQCFVGRRYADGTELAYPECGFDTNKSGDPRARERRLFSDDKSQQRVGYATHFTESPDTGATVRAIVLSEAQYQGDELKPDVLGYPLYNVMLVEDVGGGVVERIGLGRVRKSAWRQASPRNRTIILG